MKKIIYSLLSVLFIAITLNSCVDDTDYDTPQINCEEPTLTGSEVSLETIFNQWIAENDSDGDNVVEWFETENPVSFDSDYTNYISGYVVSSDQTGNFYKELYIQNDPINPTKSIKILINYKGLYTKYNVGRKIYIYLHDLALTKYRGEMVIGELETGQVSPMRENRAKDNILRNCDTTEITPVSFDSPDTINGDVLGMMVTLNNMQFGLDLVDVENPENTVTFVDPFDNYDTSRVITSCLDDSQIVLETSTYASFKDDQLPQGQGSVTGVIARNYGDDYYVLKVNSTSDFNFDNDRCDPNYIFHEDFETQSSGGSITGNGWTNYIEAGTRSWKAYSDNYSLGMSAKMGSYQSNDASSIAWLITPAINLDEHEGETFSFKSSNSYADNSNLEVLSSTDWDGTTAGIATATWTTVPGIYIVQNSDFYKNWFDSGYYDLSSASGNIYFAFKYTGSGNSNSDGTYEIDEIAIEFTE